MSDLKELLARIETEAERASVETRWVRTCGPGDEIRQGDVYLYPLGAEPEHGPALSTLQLAPGETQGSRHVVVGDAQLHVRTSSGPLEGPFLHVASRSTVKHPEHAHVSLPPGWYEVRYQRDFSRGPHASRALD